MDRRYLNIAKDIFLKYVPQEEYAVFLFGSRAEGNNHVRSDIDVGIWGKEKLSPIIRMWIEEALENSTIPYLVDIVDFSRVGDYFKEEALQEIKLWNCPKDMKEVLKISK